jgi:hypothetical protein
MRYLFAKAAFILLLFSGSAFAQSRVDQLSGGAAISSSDQFANCQGCNSSTALVRSTMAQLITFLNANLSIPVSTGISGLGTSVATALGNALNGSSGPVGNLVPTNSNCIVGNGSAWTSTACPGGTATAFSALTGSTNTTAAMVVGTGASMAASGSGTISATAVPATGISGLGANVGVAITNALNSSTGPVGELTPTNNNCILGNGSAWTSASCPGNLPPAGVGVQAGQSPTGIGDNATALPSGHYNYATSASMTAARSHNLPDSVTQGVGDIEILDAKQTVTGTNTLTVVAAGTDKLNGVTNGTVVLYSSGAGVGLSNDGAGNWTVKWYSTIPNPGANQFLNSTSSSQAQWSTFGSSVFTALTTNVGSANSIVINNGALGSSQTGTTQSAGDNSTKIATTAYVDAKQFTASIGWVAGVNPNNAGVIVFPANSTLKSIVGNVEVATGSAATVSVNVAASGTACSAGTTVHSGSFNANGTAATNQTLTLTTTAVTSPARLCLQTTGTTSWTGGTGVGTLTVTYTTP